MKGNNGRRLFPFFPFFPIFLAVPVFQRSIRHGLLTLLRDRNWGTSVLALSGIAFLFALAVVGGFAAQRNERTISANAEATVTMRGSAPEMDIQAFMIALRQQPWVRGLRYVTRERALYDARSGNPAMVELLERVPGSNPFRDTVAVSLRNADRYDALTGFVRMDQWQRIVDPMTITTVGSQKEALLEDIALMGRARTVAIALGIAAFIALLFAFIDTVRRRMRERREEVFVQRMAGQAEMAVVVPFLVEGGGVLVAGMLLSVACCLPVLWGMSLM